MLGSGRGAPSWGEFKGRPMDGKEDADRAGSPATQRLEAAIARLTETLEVLDDVGVPLACAYIDLAVSLCREELARRGTGEG